MKLTTKNKLSLKYLGINTYKEPIVYMRADCFICKSEGFNTQARVMVTLNQHSIIATLNIIETDLLKHNEASLSNYAWKLLSAKENDEITITHPKTLESVNYIRSKIYGNELSKSETESIIKDVVSGQLSDIHIAMFIAASGGNRLTNQEILHLTHAMVDTGQKINWSSPLIVDKHCVGGLPGNRTTPIVVAIVAAYGLLIPKTSSRAITSPAGTADTMEVFTNVTHDIPAIKKIIEKEQGCVTWGGAIGLSPADDLLIRLARTINLDSMGQMVASIVSKKIAAGSTHIVIDVPIGTTAKIRTLEQGEQLKTLLHFIAGQFGVEIKVVFTDGSQPVGRGIGPALEARDILAVLQNEKHAPADLREHALILAGHLIDFCPKVNTSNGLTIAKTILESGEALKKFKAICKAQGGMKEIPIAPFAYTVESKYSGLIRNIDNRHIATIAKLAGAPDAKSAGIELLARVNSNVEKSQALFKIHAETKGQLHYALDFFNEGHDIFQIEENI
ncbi:MULTISPECIES: thymidine phosphorylase family protein [Legionella]|uniref:Putative thymidine phosphorylase n=1 Tax=Legionella drozanskii LLAP-1 TaxID=1212489 RepID=A0A0W0STX8_9GAMM|nr:MULTISPECIES: thymidine phosphorylase family protein [Legionella]KTC86834.1 thymidine phosphorylase [Legionella drozanskii LLAP-1]PJE10201.1 MAG: thymidine phosphorylase [Legionella sp.]